MRSLPYRAKLTARRESNLISLTTVTTADSTYSLIPRQLYDRILGSEQHLNRYQDWAGLLLASSLHKHFDRFAFALYPRVSPVSWFRGIPVNVYLTIKRLLF